MYVNYTTASSICLDDTTVLTWHPGAVSTYVLPVVEIEMIVDKLASLVPYASANDAIKLNKTIENWNTVLNNYRSHNVGLTEMLSAESQQFIDVVNQFKEYRATENDPTNFLSIELQNSLTSLSALADFYTIAGLTATMTITFDLISQSCSEALPSVAPNYGSFTYQKAICADFDPDAWRSFFSMLNGACAGMSADGTPSNPLSSTPLFEQFCSSETLTGDSVPGGLQSTTEPETLLGFLSDRQKLLTFGADSPVELSWTSVVSESIAYLVDWSSYESQTSTLNYVEKLSIFGIGFFSKDTEGFENSMVVELQKLSNQQHDTLRTVAISLNDDDKGDYFAVRVTEDPVFGTPVFTTMGGASKCPGETGTSRRESNVRILEIRERCGADKASPCNELTLSPGDNANFGVVVENLSPTRDEVYYTLELSNYFDDYLRSGGDGNYTCGTPGQMSGLNVFFSHTDIERIPFNRLIEIPFTVTNNFYGPNGLCGEFNSIEVRLIATCERPRSSSQVYQYGVVYNETSKQVNIFYDPAHRIYASNSTATFSVNWPAARRLSDAAVPGLSQSDGSDAADAIADVLLRRMAANEQRMVEELALIKKDTKVLIISVAILGSAVSVVLWLIFAQRNKA